MLSNSLLAGHGAGSSEGLSGHESSSRLPKVLKWLGGGAVAAAVGVDIAAAVFGFGSVNLAGESFIAMEVGATAVVAGLLTEDHWKTS